VRWFRSLRERLHGGHGREQGLRGLPGKLVKALGKNLRALRADPVMHLLACLGRLEPRGPQAIRVGQPADEAALVEDRSRHSAWWQAHAARAVVQARYSAGHASARLLSEASRMAGLLDALGSSEAAQAHLLAGRVALDTGRRDEADRHFAAAAQGRRRGRALPRASGWVGAALRAEAAGRPRQLLAACREGLAVLDAHQHTLGASELRAQATAHGAELAALAQRHALRVRQPRLLLTWSERWRATALAVPVVLPYADTRLNADLAALRAVTKRLDLPGVPSASLKREQQRLEDAVRARALRVHGGAGTGAAAFSPAALLEQLGGTRLVEIAEIDGALHVLVCGAGRVRQFTAGRTVDAVRAAGFARFALRRLARDRPGGDRDGAQAILAEMGRAPVPVGRARDKGDNGRIITHGRIAPPHLPRGRREAA